MKSHPASPPGSPGRRRLSAFIAVALLGVTVTANAVTLAPSDRQDINIGATPWKYIKQYINQSGHAAVPNGDDGANPSYDDSQWEVVGLPHAANDFTTFINQESGGGQGSLDGSLSWYRKVLTDSASYRGKKVMIEFEGAHTGDRVYVNGTFIPGTGTLNQPNQPNANATHVYGFIPHIVDLTPYLRYDGTDVIAVKVERDGGDIFQDPGFGGAFRFGQSEAGIFRPVKLHVTNLVHIPENVYEGQNTWGTYVGTQSLGANNQSAVIDVQTNVVNDNDVAKTVTLTTQIVDENGKVVASDQQQKELEPHQAPNDVAPVFDQHLTVSGSDLHLWWPNGSLHNTPRAGDTGRPRPYMYKVFHTVSIDGAIVDAKLSTLGIRTITWDKSYPYVNGERIRADGASGRYDYPALGSSVPEEQQWRDLQLFAAGGGNMWRPGHSSSSPEFVDAADALGVFIIQPSGDGEGGFDKECSSKGDATAVSQCLYMRNVKREVHRDMVIRDRSHPSILAWETDNGSILTSFALELRALAAKWDDIAPRAASDRSGQLGNGDLYSCSKAGCETSMKAGDFKNVPVWGAEYWGIGSQRQAYDAQLAMLLNYMVPYSQARSVGTFGIAQWYFADTPGETGNFDEGTEDATHWTYQHVNGDPSQPIATYPDGTQIKNFSHNVRSLGDSMVDQNRFPKLIYYAYDAIWTPFQLQPVVKLANTWNRSGDIRVNGFTNCPAARLLINDVQQGTDQQPNDWTSIDQASYNLVNGNAGDPNGPSETTGKMQNVAQAGLTTKLPQQVHWDVTWQSGTAKLQCVGTDGNVVQDANGQPVQDVLNTAGKPDHILLTVVPEVALTKPDGSSFAVTANGSDAAFIEARVLDANNVLVPVDGDVNVTFTVTSGDSLVTYQGGTQQLVDWSAGSTTNFDGSQEPIHGYHSPGDHELKFEGGLQKIALRTKFTPGQVTVTATAAGMTAGSATFQISPVQQPSTPLGPPSLIATPQDDSVTVGGSGHFEAAVSGAQPMTFVWKKNGVVIDGATTSTYDTPATQPGDVCSSDNPCSTYTVSAHNSLGDTPDSAPATLHVFAAQAVTITQPLQAVTVDAGQPVHFQVAAGGSPKLSYKWFRNGTQIAGADGPSFDISAAQATDAANFSVEVDNPVAPATSGPVALVVNAARPPSFSVQPADVRANLGQSASFTVTMGGSSPFHYQWTHAGAIVGTDSPTLTIPAVSQTDVGGYQVVVTNILGDAAAATSNVAQLTLAPPGANLAREKVTYASGVQDVNTTPSSFAVDGDDKSRWASEQDSDPAKTDAAWFEVDLGAVQTFNHVVIEWEAAYGADYKIQVSNDKDTGFRDVLENSTGTGGTDDLTFPHPVSGRYVRMQGVKRGTQWGYSILEFQVYNTPSCCTAADRFDVIDDNHVTDTQSGLTWERHERGFADQGAQYKRSNAVNDCNLVNARIPSVAEALAITGKNLSTNAFPQDWSTWTSDTDPNDADNAFMVNRAGNVTPHLAENYPGNAICVSGTSTPIAVPVIATPLVAQTAGVGRSAHFAVTVNGNGPMTYEWIKNGNSVSVTYDGTYATPALTTNDNTAQYQVKVSNAQGLSTLSNVVQLTVDNSNSGFDLPPWETPPQSTGDQGGGDTGDNPGTPGDGQNGVNIALHATATSLKNESDTYLGPANAVDGNFQSRWGSSWDPEAWIALDLGSQQSFDHVMLRWQFAHSTQYTIEVSNTGNGTDWKSVTAQPIAGKGGPERVDFPMQTARYVRMHSTAKNTAGYGVSLFEFEVYQPVVPQIGTQPAAQAVTAGQTATFTVVANASGQPTYQWRFNGVNIPGATQATYSKVVATTDAGNYDVVVTNGLGQSVTSNPAVLTVAAAQGTGTSGTGTNNTGSTGTGGSSASNDPSEGFNYDIYPGFVGIQLRNTTNGKWSDSQIYVEVIAKDPVTQQYAWIDPAGDIKAITVADNTATGHLTKNGNPYPNYAFTLAQTKLLKLPKSFAGRIFISFGEPLYMANNVAADGTVGFAGPSLTNPTDPNINTYYDWYEYTWADNGMWINTTQVDQFSFPLIVDLYGDNKTTHQTAGISESRAQIFTEYNQEVSPEFQIANLGDSSLRIPAPNDDAFQASGTQAHYFDPYIDEVWQYYTTNNLHMTMGAMQFDGKVVNGVLTLTHTNWADTQQPGEEEGRLYQIQKPASVDVFGGEGHLADGTDPWGIVEQLEAQMAGAFNRHVMEDVTKWNDDTQYYLQAPTNYYAKFWHKHNIGGNAYGFSYDDVANHSSSLQSTQPEHVELSIGW